jgi:hypothetical protein
MFGINKFILKLIGNIFCDQNILLNILIFFNEKKIITCYLIIYSYIYIDSTYIFVIGHTQPKAPDPFRTPKLSG